MNSQAVLEKLPDVLLPWYTANKRQLPWREDTDPYHIWVSEIMLQQTRVEAVKGYYDRFLKALPTVVDLAKADDALLTKLWEGLGYYSRVRNLKKAAQVILSQYDGEIPSDYAALISLSGIGDYTAGAIGSIAFGLPTPAVDGNVLRIVARLLNDDTPIDVPSFKKQIRGALAAVYPKQAGEFTQALMELGATLCGPNRKPDCENCPCKEFCRGYAMGTAERLPVRLPKRSRRNEERTVFILSCEEKIALEKRPDTGLLAGLWQFPNVPHKLDTQQGLGVVEEMGLHPKEIIRTVEKEHIFTHIKWEMCGMYIEVKEMNERFTWLTAEQIEASAALPTAFRQFFIKGEF